MTHKPVVLYRVVTEWRVTDDEGRVTQTQNVWYDGTDMQKAQFMFDREHKFDLVDGSNQIVRQTTASSKTIRPARRKAPLPKTPKKGK